MKMYNILKTFGCALCMAAALTSCSSNEYLAEGPDELTMAYMADSVLFAHEDTIEGYHYDGTLLQPMRLKEEWKGDTLVDTLVDYYNTMRVFMKVVDWLDSYSRFLTDADVLAEEALKVDCSHIQNPVKRDLLANLTKSMSEMFRIEASMDRGDDFDSIADAFYGSEHYAAFTQKMNECWEGIMWDEGWVPFSNDTMLQYYWEQSLPELVLDSDYVRVFRDREMEEKEYVDLYQKMLQEADYDKQMGEVFALMGRMSIPEDVEPQLLDKAEEMMECGRYSPMLHYLWRAYRVRCCYRMSCPSTFCYSPNIRFEHYRRLVAHSMLNRIARDHGDMEALTMYRSTTEWTPILRFGEYMFGNQSAAEYISLYY